MSRVIIPIGIDCGVAGFLRQNNLRNFSLPFDWVVSYGGSYEIISKEFEDYISNNSDINRNVNIRFVHQKFPQDTEKMKRRICRFLDLLKNEEDEIIFLRKGHAEHHHNECKNDNLKLKDDLLDCEELSTFLKKKYAKLKFKIVLFLVCSECYDYKKEYHSNNVVIYNVANKKERASLIRNCFDDFKKELGVDGDMVESFLICNL